MPVSALAVVEDLDVFEDIAARFVAGRVYFSADALLLQVAEEGLQP